LLLHIWEWQLAHLEVQFVYIVGSRALSVIVLV